MKRNIFILSFICFFSNCFAANLISVFGGVSTPIKYEEQKYFINAPCLDIAYSYTFANNIVLETDFSFFYQKRDVKENLLKNYLYDFTLNFGYLLSFNRFSIVPQLHLGYARYYFYGDQEILPKALNFFCYGALIDFSYSFSNDYRIIFRPDLVFYSKEFFSPVKILIGFGKGF